MTSAYCDELIFRFNVSLYKILVYFRHLLFFAKRMDAFLVTKRKWDIVFYCEQPSHWQNIELILDEVLKKFSCDKNILLITSYGLDDYPDSKYPYNLKKIHNVPVFVLGKLDSRILITAYSALSKKTKPYNCKVIYALHSLIGLDGVYESTWFDSYDYILCAGPHQISDFRRWASEFPSLRGKYLISSGYPKFDRILIQVSDLKSSTMQRFTVVYAPTLTNESNKSFASLNSHGEQIIKSLLDAKFKVIFRPHPVSLITSDAITIEPIKSKFTENPYFEFDNSKDYLGTYSKADLMVTDFSGTGFTFSLSFLKPSVFFAPCISAELGLHGIQFEEREKLGGVARSISDLLKLINQLRSHDSAQELLTYRSYTIFNVGRSAAYIADCVKDIHANKLREDWVEL